MPKKTPAWVLPLALLFLLVFTAYWPALHGAFMWDDDRYPGNPLLAEVGGLARVWLPGQTVQYYPLTFTSFWLERRLWGLEPFGFHVVNVILHCVNAALAGLCLQRLGLRGAWLAAALFGVHPVHAESVAWLSERKNLLSGFFYLSAFASFLKFEDDGERRWYYATVGLFVLALLSKTTACTLPAGLLIARWGRGKTMDERILKAVLPLFALAALGGAMTAAVEKSVVGATSPDLHLSLLQKALLASRAPFFYAAKLLWPARLSFSYERWVLDPQAISAWLWPAAAALVAGLSWFLGRRWSAAIPAALAFFVVTLTPALGFVSVYTFRFSFVADHYQYLASLGPLALIAETLWRARWRWTAGLVLITLLPLTRGRAELYRAPENVWSNAAANAPRSALAHVNLGVYLRGRGLEDESIKHFREAIRLKPDFEDAYDNLGMALLHAGRNSEAALNFERALAIQPNHVSAHRNIGNLLLSRRQYARAERHFVAVIRLRPADAPAYNNLGVALGARGRTEDAANCFREALRLRPGYDSAQENLRLALLKVK